MIIGLSGYAQSGKDTIANVLVNEYGFTRIAFADKIRELLYVMDPAIEIEDPQNGNYFVGLQNMVDVLGWDRAKQSQYVRSLLQNLGLGARKVFGENHWIVEALKNIDREANYVITDVRFVNEADWVKDVFNGILWRVKRPGVEAVNNHVSESEMNGYKVDQILHNGGTIEDLESLVRQRMDALIANKTD